MTKHVDEHLDHSDFRDELRADHQLCLLMYIANNKLSKMYNALLAPVGLTYPQYLALIVLWERSPRAVNDVMQALGSGFGAVSPLLQKMEVKGLVRRERDKQDERRVLVHVTAKGYDMRTPVLRARRELVEQFCVDEDEITEIRTNLHKLIAKMN